MYNNHLYLIENHTNLHVGSGEANFGVIDKLIQRDPVTTYPTIHSSSLKGALKEFCEYRHDPKESENFIRYVFGDEDRAGDLRFLDAFLLAVPMRSDDTPYHMCTSASSIRHFLQTAGLFGIDIPKKKELEAFASYDKEHIGTQKSCTIEEYETKEEKELDFDALSEIVGAPAAIVPDKIFKELLEDLPVIARNQLDNGESKNLWYEEVLPRQSRLFTVICEPTNLNKNDAAALTNSYERFHGYLTEGTPVQIGANASVGYGLCTFREVKNA